MKYVSILLATALVLSGGSLARADEGDEGGLPGAVTLGPAPAAAMYPLAAPCCAASCAPCAPDHCARVWDWLCYRRPSARCECGHAPSHCVPPLYTWFLDRCPAGGCGAAHCAGGACAAPLPPPGTIRPVGAEMPASAEPPLSPVNWP